MSRCLLGEEFQSSFLSFFLFNNNNMADHPLERQLWNAIMTGRGDIVRRLLDTHPEIDLDLVPTSYPNKQALSLACFVTSRQDSLEIVKLLLAQPRIRVNGEGSRDAAGQIVSIPLVEACISGHPEMVKLLLAHPGINPNLVSYKGPAIAEAAIRSANCFKLLLADPRVDLEVRTIEGASLLGRLVTMGPEHNLKLWIASGRPLNLGPEDGTDDDILAHARRIAGMSPLKYPLLRRYKDDPVRTASEVRRELGMTVAADTFALALFYNDDLLKVADKNAGATKRTWDAVRFLVTMVRLPMELQMMVSNRVAGNTGDFVKTADSEDAFRHLARVLRTEKEGQ